MKKGWIKLYRMLIDSDTYKELTATQRDCLIVCLLSASYGGVEFDLDGKKSRLNEGEFYTTIPLLQSKMAKGTKEGQVRRSLEKLRKLGVIEWKNYRYGRVIRIKNWDKYQSKDTKKATATSTLSPTVYSTVCKNAEPIDNTNVLAAKKETTTVCSTACNICTPTVNKEKSTYIYILSSLKEIGASDKECTDILHAIDTLNISERDFDNVIKEYKNNESYVVSKAGWIISMLNKEAKAYSFLEKNNIDYEKDILKNRFKNIDEDMIKIKMEVVRRYKISWSELKYKTDLEIIDLYKKGNSNYANRTN